MISMIVAGILVPTPAIAVAPSPPEIVAPALGDEQASIPTLSWKRSPDATRYDVEVSKSGDFKDTPLWKTPLSGTVNTHAVPTTELPDATIYWRVRARNAANETSAWSESSFVRKSVGAPRLISPSSGQELSQPHQPPLLQWSPVPGAKDYRISISTDREFTDPAKVRSYTSKTTSYVVPDPALATTYFWKVRAHMGGGILSSESATSAYSIVGLEAATDPRPADDADGAVVDAVLDWAPVDGAKTYNLQIDTNINFSSPDVQVSGITGTSYARPRTLNNDQYYWRVQPVDALGNQLDWLAASTWAFRRHWPHQPELEHPADGASVGDPLFFQWTGVPHASRYTLQLSKSSTFGTVEEQCVTSNTTYTPATARDCWPDEAGTYFWRVIAEDQNDSTLAGPVTDVIVAEVGRFSYNPDLVTPVAPASGADVDLPILKWQPLAGAARYKVTLISSSGFTVTETTSATSFTPRTRLSVGTTYRWMVQAVREDGRVGAGWTPLSQPTFTVVEAPTATAVTPDPLTPDTTHTRFPSLEWEPVKDATDYRLYVRRAGAGGWAAVSKNGQPIKFGYPAGEDATEAFLDAGTYEWKVEAWREGLPVSESSHVAQFTIAAPAAAAGHAVALHGTDLTSPPPSSCLGGLPNDCDKLRQTPVLKWDPSGEAGYYRLHLAYDREMTNRVFDPVVVTNTVWTPTFPMADSQAGSAYFWHVQPCTTAGRCAPLGHASHAFDKESLALQLDAPANGVTVADDVTFSWRGYLDIQDEPTSVEANATVIDVPARVEARWYQVQVSSDPNFQTLIEDVKVDQSSFTSFANTYPEGPVYWRVRAVQAVNPSEPIPLKWSEVRSFTKQSDPPSQLAPAGTEAESGAPLRWAPLPFAASYDVEVYKNADTGGQDANKVLSVNSKQVAHSPATPLPTGNGGYAWRVRRVDAKDRRGAWSAWAKFTIAAPQPSLLTPATGDEVAPSDAVFTWEAHPTASSYRFERRKDGSSTTAESVNTDALAWAPTSSMDGGPWQWRVSALDSAENVLRESAWRDFIVVDAPEVIAPPHLEGDGTVGAPLTVVDPQWDRNNVVNSYVWLRNGSVITGETGRTYVVRSTDYNATTATRISVRVKGSLPGYQDATVTSESVEVIPGNALLPETLPGIAGTGKVGTQLTKTQDATWTDGSGSGTGITTSYAWFSDETQVQYGSNPYTVRPADVGREITLRATAKKSGFGDGTAFSTPIAASLGDAPVVTSRPVISGTATIGDRLYANSGSWSPLAGYTYEHQWLRAGSPISGATASNYTLVGRDAGRVVSVRITAHRAGYAPGVATSSGVKAIKRTSTTTATLSTQRIRPRRRVTMAVTINASGVAQPTGTIRMKRGTRTIKKVALKKAMYGRLSIRTPRLSRGKYGLQAVYSGNAVVAGSKSKRLKLVVR